MGDYSSSRIYVSETASVTSKFNTRKPQNTCIIRAVAGQRSSPVLCFATKSIKFMTKDIDLNVTQVGRDGTA